MIVNNHSDRPRSWALCIRALPAIALVLAIAAKPASAAARVNGGGIGYASDSVGAYAIAYRYADEALQRACAGMGGTVIGENVFSSTDFWNGSAFEAGVELQALCA